MNPCYFDVRYDAFSNPMGAYSFVEFVEFVEVISILYFHSKRRGLELLKEPDGGSNAESGSSNPVIKPKPRA